MITLEKLKKVNHEVEKTLHIIKINSGQSKIEVRLELQMRNIFKKQAETFWKMEAKNGWLNKCFLQAQNDLSEIQKMSMSKNPKDRIKFIADLTEDWHSNINSDETMSKVLKFSYTEGYNFAGQEVLNEFKIKENFNLRSLDILGALEDRANETSPQINKTSWELVQNKIADGFWKEGKNMDKVTKDIRDLFEETYEGRAKNIAITETGNIVSEATLNSYKEMGVEEKEWGAEPDACELCEFLDGQIVKVGENFVDDEGWQGERPLRHPSCRCFLLSVIPENFDVSNYWDGE